MNMLLAALQGLETATADLASCEEQLICAKSDAVVSEVLDARVQELRSCSAAFKSAKLCITAPEHATAAWRLACQLWNTAVGITACGACAESSMAAVSVAWIRNTACELALEVPLAALQEVQQLQLIKFCLKASEVWALLERWEQAEVLLAVAVRLVDATCAAPLQQQGGSSSSNGNQRKAEECCALMYDVHLARYMTARKLNQQDLAREALSRARTAAEELAPNPSSSCFMCYKLARALHEQVVQLMPEQQEEGGAAALLASLEQAYELLGKAKDYNAAAHSRTSTNGGAAGDMMTSRILMLESKVLLSLGYCQLTHCKDPASCLKCIDAIRQLETPDAVNPAVALLAFQAFMAQGCLEQAEKEATGIAVNDAASKDACLSVVLALLEAPETAAQAKPVLELVLGRFPSEPTILTTFTEQALSTARRATAAAAAATKAASSDKTTGPAAAMTGVAHEAADANQQGQQVCMQLEALVLEQLEHLEEGRQGVMAVPELRSRLYNALYDHGVTKFGSRDFQGAVRFFSATLDMCEDRVKGRVARVLALCHMGLGQPNQAADYCSIADSYEPGDVGTSFVRFKLLLLKGDEAGVLAELKHMPQCRGFNAHMLWFAVRESVTVNAISVAKAALQQLLGQLQQLRASSDTGPAAVADSPMAGAADGGDAAALNSLSECVVLRSLVKLQQQELDELMSNLAAAEQEGQTDHQQQQEALQMCIAQLSESLNTAAVRLKRLGLEVFTGDKEAAAVQQIEWLSVVAWNTGLQAAGLHDHQGAAVLMNTCAQLLCMLPHLGPKQLKQQKMAYALAASAGLEVHLAMPQHAGSLRLASRMVAASMAVSQKLLAAGQPGGADAASEAYDLQLLFKVALYQGNTKDIAAVASRMAAHPGVGPETLYKLVDWCSQQPYQHPEVATIALEGTLQKLMAVPAPNYRQVAWVLRTLLQRAASGEAKLKLYREACGILATLQPGAYPAIEARWLCSTAWNTGIHHARFGRHKQATDFMQTAVDMLPWCPQFQSKKCMMLQQLEQAKVTEANPAADS